MGIALSLQQVLSTTSPAVPYITCTQAKSYVSPEEAAFNAVLAESLRDSLERSKVGQSFWLLIRYARLALVTVSNSGDTWPTAGSTHSYTSFS